MIVKLYHFKTIYSQQVPIYNFIIVKFHHIIVWLNDQTTKILSTDTKYLCKTDTFLFDLSLLADQPIITVISAKYS